MAHTPAAITIDVSHLFAASGQAKLADLARYEAQVSDLVPPGSDVTLTGPGPIWLYLRLAHLLHGRVRILTYRSPVTGDLEIFNHNPN